MNRCLSTLVIVAAIAMCPCTPAASASAAEPPAEPQSTSAAPEPSAVAATPAVAAPMIFDACRLITPQEFEAVTGSPLKDTKATEHSSGAMLTSQCFFAAADFPQSVTIAVTRASNEGKHDSAREFWQRTFGRYSAGKDPGEQASAENGDKANGSREEEEHKSKPPMKVEGVGEEAFWTSGIGGALYVLKGDAFLRVGVGSPGKDEDKLAKAKALAAKALERL